MTVRRHPRRLLWPAVVTFASFVLLFFRSELSRFFDEGEALSTGVTALSYFAIAWLVSRLVAVALDRARSRRRRYPRLLTDLIAAVMFMVATSATIALFMGQTAVGTLAGSGIILALLGFAIRNVVADTLSGIALGVEGPFRIGDWVDVEELARGRVIEIGWRSTRILTADGTYMIVPNSQIARQRITNYSAPKRHFRAQITITLDHSLPIDRARTLMLDAIREAKLIQQDPAPDVRVKSYDEKGITYAIRYWVSRFERGADCRDEAYRLVDAALRDAGTAPPHLSVVGGSNAGKGEAGNRAANGEAPAFGAPPFQAIPSVSG